MEEMKETEMLRSEMVERFVRLEMTVIHRLEVQDRKMEMWIAELIREAQRLQVQCNHIITLLEKEEESVMAEDNRGGEEEAVTEGDDDQAVIVVVTEEDKNEEGAEEVGGETETLKSKYIDFSFV
jgi:hypothetical protein